MVIAALDEVAYLLNLRGSDIAYNPVFYGYVVLLSPTPSMEEDGEKKKGRMTTAILYVNSAQIQGDKKLQEHLKKSGVTIRNIDMLGNDLKEFPKKRASLDPGILNVILVILSASFAACCTWVATVATSLGSYPTHPLRQVLGMASKYDSRR
mmetsp:Transcript_44616/g.74437  ORF Transcript_44616/g.74437 Transcript_44616/m.74437 type:complete len:152 (+) Transcript_44616:768-1223(+)